MDKITLYDGTVIDIEGNGALDSLQSIAPNDSAAVEICAALIMKGNLKSAVFSNDINDYGYYSNLALLDVPRRYDELDENGEPTGRVIVEFGFRDLNATEARFMKLEETQRIHEMAIEDLGEAISEMMEG